MTYENVVKRLSEHENAAFVGKYIVAGHIMEWANCEKWDDSKWKTIDLFNIADTIIYDMGQHSFSISAYGENNLKLAESMLKGCCTKGIYDHGKRIAQMESFPENNFVGFNYIEDGNIEKVIKQLQRLNFTGDCDIFDDNLIGCVCIPTLVNTIHIEKNNWYSVL